MNKSAAMFAPLEPGEVSAAPPIQAAADWTPIVPPPVKPSNSDFRHVAYGVPVSTFRYYAEDGSFEGFQRRFSTTGKDGEPDKTFLPLRYGTYRGKTGWHAKGWAEGRPLYRLRDLVATDRAKPVVVCAPVVA